MASPSMTNTRRQLQKECSKALENYVRIMREGCDLLGAFKEGLIPEDQREKVFAHRKQEVLAYTAYTRTQTRLWSLLNRFRPTSYPSIRRRPSRIEIQEEWTCFSGPRLGKVRSPRVGTWAEPARMECGRLRHEHWTGH